MELKDQLKLIYAKSRGVCERTLWHYGGDPKEFLEIRHLEKLDRILDAQTLPEAQILAKKAEDAVFMTALNLYANHKLPGPNTPDLWEDKARKAESLVRYLEKESQSKFVLCEPGKKEKMLAQAEKQRQRAAKLREYAEKLKQNPGLPRPDFKAEEQEIEVPAEPKKRAKRTPPAEAPVVAKPKRERRLVGFKSRPRKRTA